MAIKTDLKTLAGYFRSSASNEELPASVRQFAAQCTLLTAHVDRTDRRNALLEKHLVELTDIILKSRQAQAAGTPPTQDVKTSGAQGDSQEVDETLSDEQRAQKIADEVMREAEVEAAKAPIPIRKQPTQGAAS